MITYHFTSSEPGNCEGCGKNTRGTLSAVDGTSRNRMCPRCRDTHSKFLLITGMDRKTVQVLTKTGSIPQEQKVPLKDQIPPMLARSLSSVKPDYMVPIIKNSSDWVVVEKYDGVRLVMYVQEDGTAFLGRNKSKKTGQYSDKSLCLPHLDVKFPSLAGTVIDGEVMFSGDYIDLGPGRTTNTLNATSALVNCGHEKSVALQTEFGFLEFYAFDIMKVQGVDVRSFEWRVRREILKQVVDLMGNLYIHLEQVVKGTPEEKEAFYSKIINNGGEGVMYKDSLALYCEKATSRPVSWVKRKVRYTGDGFITDFIPGEAGFSNMVGSLVISVNSQLGDPVEIARVSNLTLELREEITNQEGGLKQHLYGEVVEVSFQELSAKSKRGRHAVLERFRPDKVKEECTIDSLVKS